MLSGLDHIYTSEEGSWGLFSSLVATDLPQLVSIHTNSFVPLPKKQDELIQILLGIVPGMSCLAVVEAMPKTVPDVQQYRQPCSSTQTPALPGS